ncbi:MAG: demethylmenaquinone methyltransferase [Propionibacteriaceae bacterium]|jgi:demethylmenaquinone methyltransferase/2-methoxy-6-polyprenyl-1,4-benzoquinol methylase|nr:demethylmenaquinone methyltransferase [Propionibacteriaceae bacterium]
MPFRAQLDKDHSDVSTMFDQVARRYDLVNDVLSAGQDRLWRKALTKTIAPGPGMKILDLAAGTGTSSKPLAAAGAQVVAADISLGMLIVGEGRAPEIEFVNADALELPFADGTFDVVTISFGLRNIDDTVAALREMRRVTAKGGQLVVLEFSTPVNRLLRPAYKQYLSRVLPKLARLASSNPEAYEYLTDSILDWPDQHRVADMIAEAGWQSVMWKNLTNGIVAMHRAIAA